MKVAICITGLLKYVGGAERSASELANELISRGYNVAIINREIRHSESDNIFYPLHKNVKLVTFYLNRESVTQTNSDIINLSKKRFIDLSCKENIFVLKILIFRLFVNLGPIKQLFGRLSGFLSKTNKVNQAYDDKFTRWIEENHKEIKLWRKNLVQQRPDVVISFMQHVYILIDQVLNGYPIHHIIANRNDPFKRFPYSDPFFRKLIYKAVDNSAYNLIQIEEFRSYFLPEHHSKTIVIPNPVAFNDALNIDHSSRRKVILSVGGYRYQKNHQLLIKAFFKICHKFTDWSIEIFGEDLGLKEELDRLVISLGMGNQVKLNPPDKQIHHQYRDAAIFAMPSLYEGFSRALSEAIANELPCIVTEECFSNAIIVRNGNCGLISKNSPDDFADKLELLIREDDKRIEFGKNGREYISQFSPGRIYDMWDGLLSGLPVSLSTGNIPVKNNGNHIIIE